MAKRRGIVLGAEPMTSDELLEIAAGEPVRLGAAARSRMSVSRSVLLAAIDRGEAVYGATRRLGAGAGDAVDDQAAFQVQVIRNHLGGIGDAVAPLVVRAGIAARLGHLVLGGSGARPQVADALVALLEAGVVPVVPAHGSVGMADLSHLAAVAAVLIGEGAAMDEDGVAVAGAEALDAAGLQPLVLETHEALALINTNAFTVGASALLVARLEVLATVVDRVAALSLEAAGACRDSGDLGPFSEAPHVEHEDDGQWVSAGMVRRHLEGSFLHDERERRVQDELSFRCVPQVHGALVDMTDRLGDAVEDALAQPPENPLVDVESGDVVPNGNFAMTGFTLVLETVRLALAHVAQISERRIAVLSALARPLRAEDRAGIPGLLAYSAAELLVRIRALAQPVSLSSPLLSEVEDYATFGWTAAMQAHETVDAAVDLLAIETLHAVSLLRAAPERSRLGTGTAALFTAVEAVIERGGPAGGLVGSTTEALLLD